MMELYCVNYILFPKPLPKAVLKRGNMKQIFGYLILNCHDFKAPAIQIAFSGAFASFLFTEVASLICQNSHFLEILI